MPKRAREISGIIPTGDEAPLKKAFKKISHLDLEENNKCSICLEGIDEQAKDKKMAPTYTPCYHRFHHQCLSQWLDAPKPGASGKNVTVECPACRGPINKRTVMSRSAFDSHLLRTLPGIKQWTIDLDTGRISGKADRIPDYDNGSKITTSRVVKIHKGIAYTRRKGSYFRIEFPADETAKMKVVELNKRLRRLCN